MAHEFKVKNALQILNSHPVSGISNESSVFDTYDISSLATVSAIRSYIDTLESASSLSDLTDVSSGLAPTSTNKYLVYNTNTTLWEAGTSDSLWTVDNSIVSLSSEDYNLSVGSMGIEDDAGEVTFIDMNVTTDSPEDTINSYSFDIDGSVVATVYSESDGAGGISEASFRVSRLFVDGQEVSAGSIGSSDLTQVTTNITPTNASTGILDIGSSTNTFNNLYLDGSIYVDGLPFNPGTGDGKDPYTKNFLEADWDVSNGGYIITIPFSEHAQSENKSLAVFVYENGTPNGNITPTYTVSSSGEVIIYTDASFNGYGIISDLVGGGGDSSGGITWSTPVDSSIIPDDDNKYNLGSTGHRFNSIYSQTLSGSNFGSDSIWASAENQSFTTTLGMSAGSSLEGGVSNNLFGFLSGASLTNGNRNVLVGTGSGQSLITQSDNTLIGNESGYLNTGDNNVFLGSHSGQQSTGSNNVFLGYEAGYIETTSNKLIIANSSTNELITGNFDTGRVDISTSLWVNGEQVTGGDGITWSTPVDASIIPNANGVYDLGDGDNAFKYAWISDGIYTSSINSPIALWDRSPESISFGLRAGESLTYVAGFNGWYNTLIGNGAGKEMTTGNANTLIGTFSGTGLIGGGGNTCLGYNAGNNEATSSGNVFIGYGAGNNTPGSDKLVITNSATDVLIYGEFDNEIINLNADVIIPNDKAVYIGDPGSEGSWRYLISGSDLLYQRRESSIWVTKQTILA